MAYSYIQKTSKSTPAKRQSTRDDGRTSLRDMDISFSSSKKSRSSSSPYIQPVSESDVSKGKSSLITPTTVEQATRLEQQRQLTLSPSSKSRSSTQRPRTIEEKKQALEPNKYHSKLTRRDGSVVYSNRQGDIIREVSNKGNVVARTRMGGPGQGKRIKRITTEVILEQRMMENYNKELKKYLRAYNAEVKRVEELKGLGGYVGEYLALTGGSTKSDKTMRDDVYRYINPYEIALIRQLKETGELNKQLNQLSTSGTLTLAEQQKLNKIKSRLVKLDANKEKLATSQQKIREKILKGLGGDKKDQKWVGKALRELPAAGSNFIYHFAPSLYQTGMGLANFVDIATAPKAVRQKLEFKENVIRNLKGIVAGFDPRKPENLFNIILLAGTLANLAANGMNTSALNKQVSQAKITKGNVKVIPTAKGANAIVKGNLKLPPVKVLGKNYPGRTVPFETLQRLTKNNLASKTYKVQGSTKYLLKEASKTLKGGKIKKVVVQKPKTVLYKGEGKINLKMEIRQALKNPKAYAQKATTFKQKVSLRKRGSLGKGKTIKTRGVVTKKKVVSQQQIGLRDQSRINTNIKQLSRSKEVIKFKYTSEFTKLPPKTYASIISKASKNITSNLKLIAKQLKNPKLTSKQLLGLKKQSLAIQKNYNTVKNLSKRYVTVNKKLFSSRKGQAAIPKEIFKPGKTGAENYFKNVKKEFTKADDLLNMIKKLDAKKISNKVNIGKQVNAAKAPQIRMTARSFDPNIVFTGYKLLSQPLLLNKLIPMTALFASYKAAGLPFTPVKPGLQAPAKISSQAPSKVVIKVPAKSSVATSSSAKTTIITSAVTALIASPLIANRYLPFVGGLPIPGMGGSGRVFAIPLNRFLQAQRTRYSADLYSKLYGLKASKSEKTNLLRARRSFSGLEVRKIV